MFRIARWFAGGLLVLAVGGILPSAAAVAGLPDRAGDAAAMLRPVKFRLDYSGSFTGSWKHSVAKGTKTCGPDAESSGTFKSTLATGKKPVLLELAPPQFGELGLRFLGKPLNYRGTVTATETATGWFGGGDCYGRPPTQVDNSGCRTVTFPGWISLAYDVDGRQPSKFAWQLKLVVQPWEPWPGPCSTGEMFKGDLWELTAKKIPWMKLLRCGSEKPRACRVTIRSSRVFKVREQYESGAGYPERNGLATAEGSSRLEWSLTFVAVGLAK